MSTTPASTSAAPTSPSGGRASWLPEPGTWKYHLLLGSVAILVLGPLGGVTAAYMNFSLGFFVGGQVLAGILGSAVTFGYGAEGKHGANYIQTMAASVASMSGMAVLVQAMSWLGLPSPPWWQVALYFGCIGMFGVGVGMLYTPILVDRMQLTYPSGMAVANILRALTDPKLLRSSIGKLGSGTGIGFVAGILSSKLGSLGELGLSSSTIGAGMIVGARITVPAFVMAVIGAEMTPWLVKIGWLDEGAPFRKIGFVAALGMILGAAIVDLAVIAVQAVQRFSEKSAEPAAPVEDWKQTNAATLWAWVAFWSSAVVLVGHFVLNLPVFFLVLAIALVFLFLLINGISNGISDSNPISSAFVIAVFIMAALGLGDPGTGLMCAAILLISCSIGVDMQQDRSTGWRLGTNRVIQFRYQVIGVTMGAVMCVVLARLFMQAYPVLALDQYSHKVEGAQAWQSAMTYKFVGALQGLTHPNPHFSKALAIGVGIGFVTELLRKVLAWTGARKALAKAGALGTAVDFCIDAFLLPSPYASSFGGFVDLNTCLWFTAGGVLSSFGQVLQEEVAPKKPASDPSAPHKPADAGPSEGEVLPEDMSTTSLVGGGLIAGDSLAALALGIVGLLGTLFGG